MATHAEQVQQGFPTVYLTLTSIVIALAVEKLIDRIQGLEGLLQLDAFAVLTWLQAGVVFVVALLMFVLASYIVVGFRLDFRLQDAVMPFLVLIMVSVVIATIGQGPEPLFFYIGGLGQATGFIFFRTTLQRAGRHPENELLLRHADYRLTYLLTAASAVIPLVTAVLLTTDSIGSTAAILATALMLICMSALTVSFVTDWWRSLEGARMEEGGENIQSPTL